MTAKRSDRSNGATVKRKDVAVAAKVARGPQSNEATADLERRALDGLLHRALAAHRLAVSLAPDDKEAPAIALILDALLAVRQREDRAGLAVLEKAARQVHASHAQMPDVVRTVPDGDEGETLDVIIRAVPKPADTKPSNKIRTTAVDEIVDGIGWAWSKEVAKSSVVDNIANGLARAFLAVAARTEPIASDLKRRGVIRVGVEERRRDKDTTEKVRRAYAGELKRNPKPNAERLALVGLSALIGNDKARHFFDYRDRATKAPQTSEPT